MDRAAFVRDLENAVKRLPKTILDDVAVLAKKIIGEHRQAIEVAVPAVIEDLKSHIGAIGFEKAMGILNQKEVEADVLSVLDKIGIREEPTLVAPIPAGLDPRQQVGPVATTCVDCGSPDHIAATHPAGIE